jgi:hypothetical protein
LGWRLILGPSKLELETKNGQENDFDGKGGDWGWNDLEKKTDASLLHHASPPPAPIRTSSTLQ